MEVGTGICLDPAPSLFPEQLPGGSAGSWGRRGARAGDVELWDVEPPSVHLGIRLSSPSSAARGTPQPSAQRQKKAGSGTSRGISLAVCSRVGRI